MNRIIIIKFKSLKTKISFSILIVVILFFGFSLLLDYQLEKMTSERLLQSELNTVGDISRIAMSESLWNLDDEGILNTMDAIFSDNKIGYLIITDNSLNRQFEKVRDSDKYSLDKLSYYEKDILYQEEVIGKIKIGVTRYFVNQRNLENLRFKLIRYILVVLMLLVVVNFISRMITTPIQKLTEKTKQISLGDLTTTIDIDSSDEIGALSSSVMKMQYDLKTSFDDISNKNDEILELNRNLEIKVSERTKELESTMSELMKKEQLASLGSLVAGVSHEINTPLGVAVTAASYLNDENSTAYESLVAGDFSKSDLVSFMKNMDETSEIINKNLSRASELIRSFKEIAVNQSSENLTRFDLSEYLNSIILTLKHEYKKKCHEVISNLSEELWIESYPSAFSQIFSNLIINSLIHGFGDEREGRIEIDGSVKDDRLTLIYIDDGKGISEENINRIFNPFFTTNRQYGGSGLGMNIVYNIITDKLNGTITCESEVDKGTVFTIDIPIERC